MYRLRIELSKDSDATTLWGKQTFPQRQYLAPPLYGTSIKPVTLTGASLIPCCLIDYCVTFESHCAYKLCARILNFFELFLFLFLYLPTYC